MLMAFCGVCVTVVVDNSAEKIASEIDGIVQDVQETPIYYCVYTETINESLVIDGTVSDFNVTERRGDRCE